MKTGLTVSSIFHAGLIALVVVGIGFGPPVEPPPVESIAVDLVPVEEFSNIRMGSLDSTIVETETPSVVDSEQPAELAQPTGNTQEDQPTPEQSDTVTPAPTQQTAPAPAPQAEPEPLPEPEPVPQEAAPPIAQPEPEPEPAPEPEPEPTPVATPEPTPEPTNVAPTPRMRTAAIDQKRAEFKKLQEDARQKAVDDKKKAEDEKKKKEEEARKKAAEEQKRIEQAKADADAEKLADEVANIINTEETRGATTGEGGQATLGKETGRSARLSQSQIDGLVAQIKGCINMPPGAEENNSTAELQFSVDGGGNVVGQPQLLQSSDDTYARAVSRAVMRCGPYAVVANEDVRAQFRAREV